MKQKLMILAILTMAVCASNVHAQNFTVGNLTYSILSDSTVSVVGHGTVSGNLVIPKSVTYDGETYTIVRIENNAFRNCTDLTSLTIPNTINYIGNNAFAYCSGLISVIFNAESCTYGQYIFEGTTISRFFLGDSVSYLKESAFRCNVDTLFYNPVSLHFKQPGEVYDGIIDRSYYTIFANVSNIVIGPNVDSIPEKLLLGDTALTTLTIPENVRYVGVGAFACSEMTSSGQIGHSNLRTLHYNARRLSNGGMFQYYSQFSYASYIQNATIGNHVEYIADGLFASDTALTTINLPISVKEIGDGAFSGTNLASITLPDSVEKIGYSSFSGTSLTGIDFPASVRYIGGEAFDGTELTSVTIPATIDTILEGAFSGCPLLVVNYNAPNAYSDGPVFTPRYHWDDNDNRVYDVETQTLNIGSNVRSIPGRIFSGMRISSVVLPDSLLSIGDEAFYNTPLTNIVIPDMVTTIGVSAFRPYQAPYYYGSDNNTTSTLHRITIGASVNNIGDYAFAGITTPDTIFMRPEVPPIIAAHTFDQMPTNTKIIVPCSTKEDYEDASYWNSFTRIQEHPSCFMLITANSSNLAYGTVNGSGRYSIGNIATLSAMPYNGNAFTGWTDGNSDNPRLVLVSGNATYTANFAPAVLSPIHDTTYVDVHDTTYIDVYVHDTTVVIDTVTLTEYVPVHDTTYITTTDTVTNTIYDTVINTLYDTVTNTVYDTVTNTVYDTVDNYIYDTTIVYQTDTLWLHDTVYIHDTVYVTEEGIGDVVAINAKVYSSQGQVMVEGAEGQPVTLYDAVGRQLATKRDEYMPVRFNVPASGTYLVKIGDYAARRVVVIR